MSKRQSGPLVCHGHSRPIVEVNFSKVTPDGVFLVSASKDSQPMIRNGETGDWIGTFIGHKGAVWSCVLNEPAFLAATGSADFTARVWDATTGDEKHKFEHKHIVRTVSFARQSDKLLTGGSEKLLRIFDLERLDAEPYQFEEAVTGLRCTNWLRGDSCIAASCADRNDINIWDVRTRKVELTINTSAPVTSIEVTYDGAYLTAAHGNTVSMYDARTLTLLKDFTLPFNAESASFSPSKQKFVAAGDDMWVRCYSYENGQELECNKGHHGPVHTIRFCPGGEAYASGSEDGTIRIWLTEPNEASADGS